MKGRDARASTVAGESGEEATGGRAVRPGDEVPAPAAPAALSTDPSVIRNQWHYSLPGSSVVSTKAGLLLELRRGDTTWVRFKEDRRTWSSFAEWRAAVGDHVNPIVF